MAPPACLVVPFLRPSNLPRPRAYISFVSRAFFIGTFVLSSLLSAALARAADAAARGNGWDKSLFDYDRPGELVVEESTPTPAQVDWRGRPPQMRRKDGPDPKVSDRPAKPRTVESLEIVHLKFKDTKGDVVPALLAKPRGKSGPLPVVIAVHGLRSHKAQVIAQVGPALAERGFAILAPDLPCHGERPGDPRSVVDQSRILEAYELFRQAVTDVRLCIDLAEQRPDLDTRHGVILAGYSMGSWINALAGPADDRVRAMVLMVGGAHDIPPAALLLPQIAATDPRRAIANFAGRPLLLLNAEHDFIVLPSMGKRLFEACAEPKEQRWYPCGHLLTKEAYEDAAEWVAQTAKRLAEGADGAETRRKAG